MIEFFGFLGGALGIGAGLPQIYKILKLKHAIGLNQTTWILIYSATLSWTAYGFRIHSTSAIACNIVASAINAFILFKIVSRKLRLFLPFYTLLVFLSALKISSFVLSAFLIGLTFAQLPQLRNSIHSYKNNRDSAVSLGTLTAALASYSCWATYGFLSSLPTVWATSIIGFTLSLLIYSLESSFFRGRLPITMSN
jgi:uncharacterized protein with PQ loop repeat